jgi:hypothetical protein
MESAATSKAPQTFELYPNDYADLTIRYKHGIVFARMR